MIFMMFIHDDRGVVYFVMINLIRNRSNYLQQDFHKGTLLSIHSPLKNNLFQFFSLV